MKATVNAYAKINLFLDVVARRADGYHDVQMIMQSIRLHDVVDIRKAPANAIASDSVYVPSNKNNLAMKAAMLLQQEYKIPPVAIRLQKHIPVSAGLAGGSTDAAAVLLGCNRLFDLGLSMERLMQLGAILGSDVPFCLYGNTAECLGRGEIVQPLAIMEPCHVMIVKAPFGVSTASVYKAIDPKRIAPQKALFEQYKSAIASQDAHYLCTHLYNALEAPSMRIEPRIAQMKKQLEQAGGQNIRMSGSGPTLFGLYHTNEEAWRNFKIATSLFDNVYLTTTCTSDLISSRVRLK